MLLTRSPLVYPRRGLTVRLACVKHAASVRPEPGSNSPLKNIATTTTPQRGNRCIQRHINKLDHDKTHRWVNHIQSLKGIRPKQPTNTQPTKGQTPASHPSTGSIVHKLALTFDTLLSSQNSGTHRANTSLHPLGATRPTLQGIPASRQIDAGFLTNRHNCSGTRWVLTRTHTDPGTSVGLVCPPGRAAVASRSPSRLG